MKKSLIALAALAAVGAVSAQSSVTLYGRLDLGSSYNKATTTTAAGVTTTTKATSLAGADGVRTGGRLGVRGSEDLGGGLKANFVYEFRLDPDDTTSASYAAGTTNFGRTRTGILQLVGDFGSVSIGTYLNTIDDARSYSAGTANMAGGDFLAKNNTGFTDGRSLNSIGYRSPVFAGGFQGMIGTTATKTEVTAGAAPTVVTDSKGLIAGIGYNNGPLSALVAVGAGKLRTPLVADAKLREANLSVSYNFGMAVPYLQLQQGKSTNNLAAPGSREQKVRAMELGAKFPLGAFTPYALVAAGKTTGAAAGIATKTRAYQIGTTYDLSKRTYAYLSLGQDKISNSAVGLAGDVSKNRGYALGLVHNF